MSDVRLDFAPPEDPGIVTLVILESDTIDGSYTPIETVTPVGVYPNYISYYTTTFATGIDKWFAIKWIDNKGAETVISNPIQGGSYTVVGEIVKRVMMRDSSIDENVAVQEAEAFAERYFKMNPYLVDPTTISYQQWAGLTYMVLARSQIVSLITTSSATEYTVGLVSEKLGDSTRMTKDLEALIRLAANYLGMATSLVAQMKEIEVAGGMTMFGATDITRLQAVEIL